MNKNKDATRDVRDVAEKKIIDKYGLKWLFRFGVMLGGL